MNGFLSWLFRSVQVRPDTSGVQPAMVWPTEPPPAWVRDWHAGIGYNDPPRAYGV